MNSIMRVSRDTDRRQDFGLSGRARGYSTLPTAVWWPVLRLTLNQHPGQQFLCSRTPTTTNCKLAAAAWLSYSKRLRRRLGLAPHWQHRVPPRTDISSSSWLATNTAYSVAVPPPARGSSTTTSSAGSSTASTFPTVRTRARLDSLLS